jgi:hypothetical protein
MPGKLSTKVLCSIDEDTGRYTQAESPLRGVLVYLVRVQPIFPSNAPSRSASSPPSLSQTRGAWRSHRGARKSEKAQVGCWPSETLNVYGVHLKYVER